MRFMPRNRPKLDRTEKFVLYFLLPILGGLILGAAFGWALNLSALLHLLEQDTVPYAAWLRLVGVFLLPLGSILGYM